MTVYPFHGYDRQGRPLPGHRRRRGLGDYGDDSSSSSGSSSVDFYNPAPDTTAVDPITVTASPTPGSVQTTTSDVLGPDIVLPSPTALSLPTDINTNLPSTSIDTGGISTVLDNIFGALTGRKSGGGGGGGSSSAGLTLPKATTPTTPTTATPVATSPLWVLAAIAGGIGVLSLSLTRGRSQPGVVIVEPRPYSGGRRRR
jgi:hypothetical protein